MLWQMEVDLGIEQMPQPQKDVLHAACLVEDHNKIVESDAIRRHPLLSSMSRPTFFRSLKALVNDGYLRQESCLGKGLYKVNR
jgi:hypothetical protein